MADRPILFSAPMVRAILAGTKAQTRRVVRDQTAVRAASGGPELWTGFMGWQPADAVLDDPSLNSNKAAKCPYGMPGDRLWVREAFRPIYPQDPGYNGGQPIAYDYRATYTQGDRLGDALGIKRRWKPSIHMPRWASRITLEITGVRVERLKDISEADAIAEGIDRIGGPTSCTPWKNYGLEAGAPHAMTCASPVTSYATLWTSINGPESWDANPWVWVVAFRRAEPTGLPQ
jgi:hypothetical protein